MNALNVALWLAGSTGKVLTIVGIILSLVVVACVGVGLVHRFGRTKARSLDSETHPSGEAGRSSQRRERS